MNDQHTDSFVHPKMPQMSDLQRAVIVLFKNENPTLGLKRCAEILPNFFSEITRHCFSAASLKINGSVAAGKRKPGTGTATRLDSSIKRASLDLSCQPNIEETVVNVKYLELGKSS